jgi:hypothetical protein
MRVLYWTIGMTAGAVVLAGSWLNLRVPPAQISPDEASSQPFSGDRWAAARQQAWEAAVLVQRPPHGPETWQQAKLKWRQAIRLLEAIPTDAPTAAQVQEKLKIYRRNYAEISDLLATEEAAVTRLQAAKDLALQAAVAGQNPPHSPRVWQRARDKWQAAISHLEAISPQTSVFRQREEKLTLYRANHRQISRRIDTETIARSLLQRVSEANARLSALPNRALVSTTSEPVGLRYEDYDRLVQELETALGNFERQGGKDHPLGAELRDTIADYRFASDLWKSYLNFKQRNSDWLQGEEPFNQLLPLSASDRARLLERYQFEPFSKNQRVSLKFTIWEIWRHAHDRIAKTQEKFQAAN